MQTQRQKILVVDDDMRLRDLLKRYLSEQGFAVDTVAVSTLPASFAARST